MAVTEIAARYLRAMMLPEDDEGLAADIRPAEAMEAAPGVASAVDEAPELLLGGTMTTGVRRVGSAVHRPAGPWTPSVAAFLSHLHANGFTACPRPVRHDDKESVEEFVVGEGPYVPSTTGEVSAVAALVRQLHEAAESFPSAGQVWGPMQGFGGISEIVCHNDLGPHNTLRRPDGSLVFVDWDFAAPASRMAEIAHAAWRFVGLWPPPGGGTWDEEQTEGLAERLVAFADGYRLKSRQRAALLPSIVARMLASADLIRTASRYSTAHAFLEARGDADLAHAAAECVVASYRLMSRHVGEDGRDK